MKSSHSRLSLLLEQPGMVHIWYRGTGWCLTVQQSSQESWNRTQGQIHGKKFKHMKHIQQTNVSKTSTVLQIARFHSQHLVIHYKTNLHDYATHLATISAGFVVLCSCLVPRKSMSSCFVRSTAITSFSN